MLHWFIIIDANQSNRMPEKFLFVRKILKSWRNKRNLIFYNSITTSAKKNPSILLLRSISTQSTHDSIGCERRFIRKKIFRNTKRIFIPYQNNFCVCDLSLLLNRYRVSIKFRAQHFQIIFIPILLYYSLCFSSFRPLSLQLALFSLSLSLFRLHWLRKRIEKREHWLMIYLCKIFD